MGYHNTPMPPPGLKPRGKFNTTLKPGQKDNAVAMYNITELIRHGLRLYAMMEGSKH